MNDSYLALVPVLSPTYADQTVPSMMAPGSSSGFTADRVMLVDNSRDGFVAEAYGLATYRDPDGHNLGVARAWNVGAQYVLDHNLDYLVIVSSVLLWGPALHTTWVEQMERHWGEVAIECDGHSWHLIALHRRCFEEVGLFDPAFYPAYVESIDWCRRLRMVGLEGGWPRCWVNAMSLGHGLHIPEVECPWPPLGAYYRAKWNGDKGGELWTRPWGNRPLDYYEEEEIPVLAARYKLGEYGVGWW